MKVDLQAVKALENDLDSVVIERIATAADRIVAAKERGGKVAVVTGSGPNLHEGVTTLIAELMRVGIIDGVTTSSATLSHEMAGTLDKVKRCQGLPLGLDKFYLPRGYEFELTVMSDEDIREIAQHMPLDFDLIEKLKKAEGKTIIKAAGNLGYPMGLWMEHFAMELCQLAHGYGATLEEVAGLGADERTMIGIGARKGLPVMVTIPQLIGGGLVGLNIADSIGITERATRLARMLSNADVIIESGVALTQEIHDGPFERYTGHGGWSAWHGHFTYTLEGKTLVRIDLDPALEMVCEAEREGSAVQQAIANGMPKTKLFKTPFRMEMSGFARHEGSIPIISDIGVAWPLIACRVAEKLGINLEFISFPQGTEQGKAMREYIVNEVRPVKRDLVLKGLAQKTGWNTCTWADPNQNSPAPNAFPSHLR